MKCRVKNKGTMTCPKCKHKIKRDSRGFKCNSCGYFKREEESNWEKRMMQCNYESYGEINVSIK